MIGKHCFQISSKRWNLKKFMRPGNSSIIVNSHILKKYDVNVPLSVCQGKVRARDTENVIRCKKFGGYEVEVTDEPGVQRWKIQ